MHIKVIIQNHYVERMGNVRQIINDLESNSVPDEDIYVISDYPAGINQRTFVDYHLIQANFSLPINWWHAIGSVLDADYVALIGDDLSLQGNSIPNLVERAELYKGVDVFGYEGGDFADTDKPYSDSKSHTVTQFEKAQYLIRFHFCRPQALVRALRLYTKLSKKLRGHDDLLLSLSNNCGLVPTTKDSGFYDLDPHGVGYSLRGSHYEERNLLVNMFKK